jgi:hypothetical protein
MRHKLDLHPSVVREIEGGKYKLFGMDCPQPVMAAYERSWARRGHMMQNDGDLLIGWVVESALLHGKFELASDLRLALEELGWQPPAPS